MCMAVHAAFRRHARLSISLIKSKSIEEHCFSLWHISIIILKLISIKRSLNYVHHARTASE